MAFTPDEEIGRGVHPDLPKDLGADFAYTFDGGKLGEIEYESFSADGAKVRIDGVSIHPGTAKDTLVNALLAHCGDDLSGVGGMKRPGIVHRIDKETSGLLVVAKSDAAHQGLAKQFEAHTVERYYRAVVYGVPDANDPRLRGIKGASFEPGNILKLQTQLARHKHDRQKQAVVWNNGRHAVTDFVSNNIGVIAKIQRRVAVGPAAFIGQRGWQFPMIKRLVWFQPAFQNRICQPVIKIQPFGVYCAPVWHHPRPRG